MKTILSGVQPSGMLTLGNYLGAISQFVNLQNSSDDQELLFFIADLHAITVPQDATILRKNIKSLTALYLACGLDPNKSTIFVQSEVKEHSELGYILQSLTYIGELERMTQFKDKMAKQTQGVSSALLTYPVLMAADILLYNSDYVPVGVDQKQHLEMARNLAERFNSRYSDTFKIPEPLILKSGAKIMSLQDPTKKMSKSDKLDKATIFLLDDENIIRKKIASAVTDSDGFIKYDVDNKPGISNLLTIYSCCMNLSIKEAEEHFKDANYGTLKSEVSDSIIKVLKPIQDRYNEILNNNDYINKVLDTGKEKASYIASKMINKVKHKVGLGRF